MDKQPVADGMRVPLVDFNQCEAKAACVTVCPHSVFEIRRISPRHKAQLSVRGRIKTFFHGSKKAYTPGIDACNSCSLCVQACPENAIQLVPRSAVGADR